MRRLGQTSLSLQAWTMVLVFALLCACSLGTEVGNGDRPKPSEESTERNPKSVASTESQPPMENAMENGSPTSSGPASSRTTSGPVNGGGGSGTTSPAKPPVQTGNPADANCLANGGRLEAKKDARGNEYSLCYLPNGVICESWSLFRGECPR